MNPLRILITNQALVRPAGTECYVNDVARAMQARGHQVAAFSFRLGPVAERLATVATVTNDLDQIPWVPDLIHGHHRWETTLAALKWPEARVLSFCHGALPWQESPCAVPWVARYVAVDEPCRERIVREVPGAAGKTVTIFNGIDTARFRPRAPLPPRPRRALVFSNYASAQNVVPAIREACAAAGIELDIAGSSAGRSLDDPESSLGGYDIVFAKARSALEAMAVGCAVILCDVAGLGPLVGPDEFTALRPLNFGFRCLTDPVEPAHIAARLQRYDPAAAAAVSHLARTAGGLDVMIVSLESLYREVVAEHMAPPDPQTIARAAVEMCAGATLWHHAAREACATLPCADPEKLLPEVRQMLKTSRKLSAQLARRQQRIEALEDRIGRAKTSRWTGRLRRWFGHMSPRA